MCGENRRMDWRGSSTYLCSVSGNGTQGKRAEDGEIEDLDTSTWEIGVVNPKGKDRYPPRELPVLPQARKAVMRDLDGKKRDS